MNGVNRSQPWAALRLRDNHLVSDVAIAAICYLIQSLPRLVGSDRLPPALQPILVIALLALNCSKTNLMSAPATVKIYRTGAKKVAKKNKAGNSVEAISFPAERRRLNRAAALECEHH